MAGVPDFKIQQNKDFGNPDADVVEELLVDGRTVHINITIGGNEFLNTQMVLGRECQAMALDGRPAKVLHNLS